MQGNGRGRNAFFDPFAGFVGFGGHGGHGILVPSFLWGSDPFDNPFFNRPFRGGLMESYFFGSGGNPLAGGMFESNFFGPTGNAFTGMHPSGFLGHEAPNPQSSREPVIEELNSDDDKEEDADKETQGNGRKLGRSNEPLVEVPDDDDDEDERSKHLHYRVDNNRFNNVQSRPQTHNYTFQSSTVTYGGVNGAYHTSSRTRRTGSDGITFEESKEADSATRQATHRLSRGLHHKGHAVTRKLNSDGNVETMQTLHNLNEDELPSFDEAWKGNAQRHMPGLNKNFIGHGNSASNSGQNMHAYRGGWALPSTQLPRGVPDNRVSRQPVGRSAQHARGRACGRRF